MTSRRWAWWFSDDDGTPHGGWRRIADVDDPTFDAVANPEEESDPPVDLWRGLSKLTESQRFVIHLRYGLGGCSETPLEDIAQMMKVSNQAVSRIEQRALAALRRGLEISPLVDGFFIERPAEGEEEARR